MNRGQSRRFHNGVSACRKDFFFQDTSDDKKHTTQDMMNNVVNEAASTILTVGQTLKGTGFKARELRSLISELELGPAPTRPFDNYSGSHQPLPDINLTAEDVTRFRMAWRAVKFWGKIGIGSAGTTGFTIRAKPMQSSVVKIGPT